MRTVVFAYSRQGCGTARRVAEVLKGDCCLYTMERFQEEGFQPLPKPSKPLYAECLGWADALVFVGSCGIAVREIAPYVKDKRTDPAVICIDELGRFVIPLLSGHIGGANALAQIIAQSLGAVPVITTATDINEKFSVDSWAVNRGYIISSMKAAKTVSAEILEKDVPLCSDYPIVTALPSGVISGQNGKVGICITCQQKKPYEETLRLVPRILHLGIGCRKGTETSTIREVVDAVLKDHNIDHRAIKCVASIDLKAEEAGLLQFCEENKLPISFYSAEELKVVPGEFTPSGFVQSITGVDNVCERSALIGAKELIVKKTARNGVTVAVAAEHLEVRFE